MIHARLVVYSNRETFMNRSIAAMIVGIAASLASHCTAGAPTTQAAVPNKIAHFRIAGAIQESPSQFELFAGPDRSKGLRELIDRLDAAQSDGEVVAVALELQDPDVGLAQIQELSQAIEQCKKTGKEVFCFVEEADASTYMLAAAASRITLAPAGMVSMPGIHGQLWYFKGLLEKLGLDADMQQVGSYKGAAEPITRTEPSEPIKEQLNWLFDDMYQQMVDLLATSRNLSEDRARQIIDRGWFTAQQAKDANLVDTVAGRQEFCDSVAERYTPKAKLVKNYGREKGPQVDLASPFSLLKLLGEMVGPSKVSTKPAIALIYIDGIITTGKSEEGLWGLRQVGSTTIRKALDKARQDDSVKAVVIRVDSPGGSALASDIIFNAVRRCAEAKPLIVSMGNVAGSGGYYVAVGADQILAEPASITGSIGVIGGKLVLAGLLEKIGITTYDIKRGRMADLFSPGRRFDEQQRAVLQDFLEDTYGRFTERVRQAREDRLKADISELAGGRVFTGRQASENGLIDGTGSLADALVRAAEKAQVVDYEIRVMPPPKTFVDVFQELLGLSNDEEASATLPALERRLLVQVQPIAAQLNHQQLACLARIMQRIGLLFSENILLVMPYELCWP
jgi:protease-4